MPFCLFKNEGDGVFVLNYQGELGSHCKAPNCFYKNKACCPRGQGRCAEIHLALLYPHAKPGAKAETRGAILLGSNVSHRLLSLSAAHPAGLVFSWLLSGAREQSSLHLQPAFDLGVKSLQWISSSPRLCCSSWLAGKQSFLPTLKCCGFAARWKREFSFHFLFLALLVCSVLSRYLIPCP